MRNIMRFATRADRQQCITFLPRCTESLVIEVSVEGLAFRAMAGRSGRSSSNRFILSAAKCGALAAEPPLLPAMVLLSFNRVFAIAPAAVEIIGASL